jgi:hypothetical protein
MNVSLGERIWFNHMIASMPAYVRVIGRVIGEVFITDISRKIFYNKILDIPVSEVNRSKDLADAIKKNWIEVIQGKEYLNQAPAYVSEKIEVARETVPVQSVPIQTQVIQQSINLDDIKRYIDDSAATILEQLKVFQSKDSGSVDKNLAAAIAEQLASRLNIDKKSVTTIDDKPDDVFINLDQTKELKTNISEGNLGTVTTKDDKKAKSVAKKLKSIKGD